MDLLSGILNVMKMSGSLYFRTSFTPPWGVAVPHHQNVARFHYLHRGRCYVRIADQEKSVFLQQGDLIIIPRGAKHTLADPEDTEITALDTIVEDSGFTGHGALMVGDPETGNETQLICGHFAFDPGARHVLLDALPDLVHVKDYGKASPDWLDSTLGGDLVALKLSEIMFTQAIRHYIENEGRSRTGMAGFADLQIRSALIALHNNPADSWSVNGLAKIAGMSRTAFSNRFNELIGSSPLKYLINWRMQLARQMLIDTDYPIIDIALKTGYQSEAAFGRIFKRHFDMPPAGYRRSLTDH